MITWAERAKAAISQKGQSGTVKTDETAVSRLLAVSAVPIVAASAMPKPLSSVLAVTSPTILEKYDSSIVVIEDPDRWPHSSAKNGVEIDAFAASTWLNDTEQLAAQAYHAHHFNCHPCIAAGRGNRHGSRCAVGLALWNTYLEGLSQ
jgi:hypothetical protein